MLLAGDIGGYKNAPRDGVSNTDAAKISSGRLCRSRPTTCL